MVDFEEHWDLLGLDFLHQLVDLVASPFSFLSFSFYPLQILPIHQYLNQHQMLVVFTFFKR